MNAMHNPSIFTQIVNGDIPCHKIYEDERTLAFLNIYPSVQGHTLVIPKNEVEFLWDLPAEDYQAVMATCQKIARRLRRVLNVPYVGEKVVGIDVPHAHVHLVPFTSVEEYKAEGDMGREPDHEALAKLAERIAF
jgi:histidine triad (HIT) family protein